MVFLPVTGAYAEPQTITVGGSGQTAPAGQQFLTPVTAYVQEPDGTGSDGAAVEFAITPNTDGTYPGVFDDGTHQAVLYTEEGETPGGVTLVAGDQQGPVEESWWLTPSLYTGRCRALALLPGRLRGRRSGTRHVRSQASPRSFSAARAFGMPTYRPPPETDPPQPTLTTTTVPPPPLLAASR
jgi:hypothetical protein